MSDSNTLRLARRFRRRFHHTVLHRVMHERLSAWRAECPELIERERMYWGDVQPSRAAVRYWRSLAAQG